MNGSLAGGEALDPQHDAEGNERRIGWPQRRRLTLNRLGSLGPILVASALAGGCGGLGGVATQIGVAACRQAARGLQDPVARQTADRACQIGASGDISQVAPAAKQAAHDGCIREAAKIVDPVARGQIQALCPTFK